MKTIVFTLKEGQENNTGHGWKRIELIPGMTMPHRIPNEDGKPSQVEQLQWCFVDGKLDPISDELFNECSWGSADESEQPYVVTYEESKWM